MRYRVLLAVALAVVVSVLAGGVAAAAPDPSCPDSNPPNTLALAAGSPQTSQLGEDFANPLQVTLANTNGCPVTPAIAGVPVTFSAPASGASGTFSASGSNSVTVGSDQSGLAAAAMFRANGVAGSYAITASSAYGSVSFAMTNTAAGIPSTISALAPASRSARVATRYREPLAARVLDAGGNPVQGASVTFALGATASGSGAGGGNSPTAGASFPDGTTQATETTDATGIARSPRFSANSVAGRFTATATTGASGANGASGGSGSTAGMLEPASFSLDNLAAKASAVRLVGGAHRSGRVGSRYGNPLRVRVVDSSGRPVQGVSVTFTLGASGGGSGASGASSAGASFVGGASQATTTTTASGLATSPRFVANTTAGRFTASATLVDSARAASFSLRNLAGVPRTVTAGAAASASAVTGARFPVRLAVSVTDADANPVSGVLVTFSAPTSGPSGTFAHSGARTVGVRTNASGVAVAPVFTANAKPGGYVVKASARQARVAAFALVNLPPGQQ